MHNLIAGLDTVSIQEVNSVCLQDSANDDGIFTPNGVSLEEIEEAAALGVQINIDNPLTRAIWEQTPWCSRMYSHQSPCDAGGNANISVGISIPNLDEASINCHILFGLSKYRLRINGIHMHTGSDILDTMFFACSWNFVYHHRSPSRSWVFDFGSGLRCLIIPTILRPISKTGTKTWGAV